MSVPQGYDAARWRNSEHASQVSISGKAKLRACFPEGFFDATVCDFSILHSGWPEWRMLKPTVCSDPGAVSPAPSGTMAQNWIPSRCFVAPYRPSETLP